MAQSSNLTERLRSMLGGEPSTREVSMFGGRSFMVNDKMVASARKDGCLLIRVDAARHEELIRVSGASQAEMGAGRLMGQGWISVSAESITSDEQLAFWLDVGLDHNRACVRPRS